MPFPFGVERYFKGDLKICHFSFKLTLLLYKVRRSSTDEMLSTYWIMATSDGVPNAGRCCKACIWFAILLLFGSIGVILIASSWFFFFESSTKLAELQTLITVRIFDMGGSYWTRLLVAFMDFSGKPDMILSKCQMSVTVMMFWVRVPVLSEAMMFAEPRASTMSSFLR